MSYSLSLFLTISRLLTRCDSLNYLYYCKHRNFRWINFCGKATHMKIKPTKKLYTQRISNSNYGGLLSPTHKELATVITVGCSHPRNIVTTNFSTFMVSDWLFLSFPSSDDLGRMVGSFEKYCLRTLKERYSSEKLLLMKVESNFWLVALSSSSMDWDLRVIICCVNVNRFCMYCVNIWYTYDFC